ncbi:hypothetical protein [Anaerobiospirillum sp. NML120511]|uniref:hypothetical protein n=1 Tax=Anaerobiospirillum sp. NML120511 TaxID=2932819 RepID=UPI001FF3BA8C|nr:hypothetical protein [Anaerobiospirillum sp. NML120511]MCK0535835.1 hypothetical protein [Anaerobiospirillum sp. NML120511]
MIEFCRCSNELTIKLNARHSSTTILLQLALREEVVFATLPVHLIVLKFRIVPDDLAVSPYHPALAIATVNMANHMQVFLPCMSLNKTSVCTSLVLYPYRIIGAKCPAIFAVSSSGQTDFRWFRNFHNNNPAGIKTVRVVA